MGIGSIGRIAFYVGIAVSLVLGWTDIPNATWILVVLGIIVGLLNVTEKESSGFLLSALVLVTAGVALGTALDEPIKSVLHAFAAFVAAAAVVVALKEAYKIGKNK